MVHALEEAWRVLVAEGLLLDVRPIAVDCEVVAIKSGEKVRVATLDQSPGVPDDVATDRALDESLRRGFFLLEESRDFFVDFYWESAQGLAADVEQNWMRRGTPLRPAEVRRADGVIGSLGEGARLRLRLPMIAARYRRNALR